MLEISGDMTRPPAQPVRFRVNPVMKELYCFYGRGSGPITEHLLIECGAGNVLVVTRAFGPIELVVSYCRGAVIDRWSVRCISEFHRVSNLACTRSWAEPVKPERTIHQAARLHLAKEEPWMTWDS